MAAILNSAMLDSAILPVFSSQKHLHFPRLSSLNICTKTLSLIHSDSPWWWQANLKCAIFNSAHLCTQKTSLMVILTNLMMAAILNFCHHGFRHLSFPLKLLTLAKTNSHYLHKKTSLVHSDSTWWWQPSWILPCWIQTLPYWIQTLFYLLSDLLKNTLSPLWLWFKLIQSDSNSFILT